MCTINIENLKNSKSDTDETSNERPRNEEIESILIREGEKKKLKLNPKLLSTFLPGLLNAHRKEKIEKILNLMKAA